MIRWLLTPIMRPIARRKLNDLYQQRQMFYDAIGRVRRSKGKVSPLYQDVKLINIECRKWERWFE